MTRIESTHNHLDPTTEITLEAVKQRAVKGVVVLTGRTFFLQLVSLAAWFFLTVFLDAAQIGIFFIITAVVNFLRYFADIGLAAALIQKKEAVTDADLKTTFTIQQTLVITLVVILFLAAPSLEGVYSLSEEGKILLYALGISFILSSLKTIPSVLLERELQFGKLVIPDILENIVYNITVVVLAWQGFGIASFTWAVLLRGVVGLVAIYTIRPWLPGFAFSREPLKKLLTFGIPYQVNTFLATIKDDGLTAVLGGILGPSGIGYLGWAQKWAQTPLRLFMDNVLKVTFPAFSRMQDEEAQLAGSVTRSIFFVCFLVFPSIAGLVILAPALIEIVPRYEKWQPALLALGLVSINVIFAAATTQLTNLLNAIGRIKTTFKLMVMWTILTWVLVPVLAVSYGVNGAAFGYSLVGVSSVIAIYIVRKYVNFSISEGVLKPLGLTLVMSFALLILKNFLPSTTISVVTIIILGALIYMGLGYLFFGPPLVADVKKSLRTLFSK